MRAKRSSVIPTLPREIVPPTEAKVAAPPPVGNKGVLLQFALAVQVPSPKLTQLPLTCARAIGAPDKATISAMRIRRRFLGITGIPPAAPRVGGRNISRYVVQNIEKSLSLAVKLGVVSIDSVHVRSGIATRVLSQLNNRANGRCSDLLQARNTHGG
jgi:hypothetical protein